MPSVSVNGGLVVLAQRGSLSLDWEGGRITRRLRAGELAAHFWIVARGDNT